ncbi:MAG: 50S ribosomal protein L4 [Eggerthellaceae bacterium]|jgi:large subunit ribosomal protein L4|nr:50S ribosomal protein L4 [Eggerthellaceae bacterium]MDR2721247.1 50S ribosomal protein L4 [Coriobacteriaceae bacterium]
MASIEVKDTSGKKVKSATLSADVFGVTPNMHAMHEVVRAQRAAWRSGTSSTLTRGQVRGGGKKPFRQKGTGRARQGSIRSPHYTGGGVVFGPHPRSYALKIPNKVVKLAMRSALSAKLADKELIIVDSFGFEKPSTKQAAAALKALGCDHRTTVVIADDDVNAYLSLRNLERVNVIPVAEANTYELIDNKALIFTMDALKRIEEVLA